MNLQENISRIKQMMVSEEMVQSDAWKAMESTDTIGMIRILTSQNQR
jgi:hypothetical protein